MSDMTVITEKDVIESVADALQYISYYHPMDYIRALGEAYEAEQGAAAKDAIAQILTNSRMCAEGHRPICQDTGIVNVFVKWGMDCRLDDNSRSMQEVIDEGVRRAYLNPENRLRASILRDPAFSRQNTRDNTPCVLNVEMVPGNKVIVDVAAKGGGSENKTKFKMMNPSDSIVDWVLDMVPQMGAGWCPPGMLGIGIGGTAEKAVALAKGPTRLAATDQVVVVRRMDGQRQAAMFDLGAIRKGAAPDPEILPGDQLIVGLSRAKAILGGALVAVPALAAGFIAVFVAVTFYVSELQEGLNRTAAIERAANLSDAVAAFRASGVQSIQHGHLAIHEHEVELFLG